MESNGMSHIGKVFICGAGPGDPGLITIRALDLISSCEVVLYDRLVSRQILEKIPQDIIKVYVGREVGDPTTHQDNTNDLMLKYAREGKKVLRLKGGDPMIFGRGGEEAEFLRAQNIPFEIIPGISSAIGSCTYAGIPLTHRKYSSSVAIVTGHEDPEKDSSRVNWSSLAVAVDTIVILMGLGSLDRIIKDLINAGMNSEVDVAVIENGTTPDQRVIKGTLGSISKLLVSNKVKAPSVIVIGRTVSLHDIISWFTADKNERIA